MSAVTLPAVRGAVRRRVHGLPGRAWIGVVLAAAGALAAWLATEGTAAHGLAAEVDVVALPFLLWAELRLLAWRTTVRWSGFAVFLGIGSVTAVLASGLVERLALAAFGRPSAYAIGGVVEELATWGPVAWMVLRSAGGAGGRRLTMADTVLVTATAGVGFQFVEATLSAAGGSVPHYVSPLLAGWVHAGAGGSSAFYVGHILAAATVGAALALTVRARARRPGGAWGWVPLALVGALVCFDHATFDWKVNLAGPAGFPGGVGLVRGLYALTLDGRLELALLVVGLVLVNRVDAGASAGALRARPALHLAGEPGAPGRRPGLLTERVATARRAPDGWAALRATAAAFSSRHALGQALEERAPHGPVRTGTYAEHAGARADSDRARLDAPPDPDDSLPAATARQRTVLLIVVAVALVMAALARSGVLASLLHGRILAFLLAAAGFAYALWRWRSLRHAKAPSPDRDDGITLLRHPARRILVTASVASSGLGLVAAFLSTRFALGTGGPGHAAFVLDAAGGWAMTLGNAGALLGAGGLGAAGCDCDDECAQATQAADDADQAAKTAQADADRAAADLAVTQAALDQLGPPLSPAGDSWMTSDSGPLAGRTLTSSDLRRMNLVRKAIRAREANGEISHVEAQQQLAGVDDPANIDQVLAQGKALDDQQRAAADDTARAPLVQRRDAAKQAADQARQRAADAAQQAARLRDAALQACHQQKQAGVDDLRKRFNDIKDQFDQLQHQLTSTVACDMGRLEDFSNAYDDTLKHSLDMADVWQKAFARIAPQLQDLYQMFGSMSSAMGKAGVADKVLDALMAADAVVGIGSGLLDAYGRGLAEAAAAGDDAAAQQLARVQEELNRPVAPSTVPQVEELTPDKLAAYEGPASTAPGGFVPIMGDASSQAKLLSNASKVKRIPGVWDVAVHGGQDGSFYKVMDGGTHYGVQMTYTEKVSVDEIRQALLDAGWQPGQPVRLLSCWSGSSGAAEKLAEALSSGGTKTWVRAPRNLLGVDSQGVMSQMVKTVGSDGKVYKPTVKGSWTNLNCPVDNAPSVFHGETGLLPGGGPPQ